MRRALAVVAVSVAVAPVALPPPGAAAASRGAYVVAAQNRDGGFPLAPGGSSSQLGTGWAVLGLAAAGRNPLDVRRDGRSAIDYLRGGVRGMRDIGEIERTVLVLRAAGLNPRRFGGRNLFARMVRFQRRDGSFSGFVSYTSFGVMAMRASGVPRSAPRIRRALAWLRREQNRDGGFNLTGRGRPSTSDDTGYALQALVAGGWGGRRPVRRAVRFLGRTQRRDGGYPFLPAGSSNAQSTAYAVQGLTSARLGRSQVRAALRYLDARTAASGRVSYSGTSSQTPVWVTAQAVAAASGRALPLAPVPRAGASGRGGGSGASERRGGGSGSPGGRAGSPGPVGARGAGPRPGSGKRGRGGEPRSDGAPPRAAGGPDSSGGSPVPPVAGVRTRGDADPAGGRDGSGGFSWPAAALTGAFALAVAGTLLRRRRRSDSGRGP